MANSKQFDLFLSHNWGQDTLDRDNHERVGILNKALSQANVKTWFDSEQMNGHIGQAMTDGIDGSKRIVVFITSRYIDKVAGQCGMDDNCRKEFDYSVMRKGIQNMIAIVMEPDCLDMSKWHGSLGAVLANQLYIDWSTDDKLNDCVSKILHTMNASKLSDEVQLEQGSYSGALNELKQPHGYGIMKYNNGNQYEGPWVNGKMEGAHGNYKHKVLGITYVGHFANDKKHGHGTLTMKNGDKYDGEYVAGYKEGKGRFTSAAIGEYVGDYKQGKMSGRGAFHYKGGSKYQGEFQNHKRHGRGTLTNSDGTFYDGDWEKGMKHGKGKMIFANNSKYEGDWVKNNMEGQCSLITYTNGDKYKGYFKNNKAHGVGTYNYASGAEYVGEYSQGKKWGSGVYTFRDGKQFYRGEWENNKMHGEGVRSYPNGDTYNGQFLENRRHGQGRMKFKELNTIYDGEWRSDEMHGKGKVKVEDCDSVTVNTKWWKRNPTLSWKIKDIIVTFNEGSLASSTTVKSKKKIFSCSPLRDSFFVDCDESTLNSNDSPSRRQSILSGNSL